MSVQPAALKKSDSGSWAGDTSYSKKGGMKMQFQVTNVNILGVVLRIDSNLGGNLHYLIPPLVTMNYDFTCFGNEPMGWSFDISSTSDAFIVTWDLYSTWIEGDPPNPPKETISDN